MTSRRPAGRGRTVVVVLVALVSAMLVGPLVPAVSSAAGLCYEQRAAAIRVQADIDAHNARAQFVDATQAAAVAAYNAEARELNAARRIAVDAFEDCRQAESFLAGLSTAPEDFRIQVPGSFERRLKGALGRVPAGYRPVPWVPHAGPATVPPDLRPVYDRLRRASPRYPYPDVPLQGRARPQPGDPDPSNPGTIILGTTGQPLVRADHIYPLAAIIRLPGFLRLTPRNMYAVVNGPVNLQWLSRAANSAKSSRSMGAVRGVDPGFARQQVLLEQHAQRRLERAIELLLRVQARGGR